MGRGVIACRGEKKKEGLGWINRCRHAFSLPERTTKDEDEGG